MDFLIHAADHLAAGGMSVSLLLCCCPRGRLSGKAGTPAPAQRLAGCARAEPSGDDRFQCSDTPAVSSGTRLRQAEPGLAGIPFSAFLAEVSRLHQGSNLLAESRGGQPKFRPKDRGLHRSPGRQHCAKLQPDSGADNGTSSAFTGGSPVMAEGTRRRN